MHVSKLVKIHLNAAIGSLQLHHRNADDIFCVFDSAINLQSNGLIPLFDVLISRITEKCLSETCIKMIEKMHYFQFFSSDQKY